MLLPELPPEILGAIVDNIEPTIDLRSLALTCTTLRDIVIADYLDYRTIVAPYHHTSLWNRLAVRKDLARNVREFAFIDAKPTDLKYILSCMHLSLSIPSTIQISVGDTDPAVWAKVFEGMKRLRKLYVLAPGEVELTQATADGEQRRIREFSPLAVACSHFASLGLDELHLSLRYRNDIRSSHLDGFSHGARNILQRQLYPDHPLWRVSNLTSLDLANTRMCDNMYEAFCSMVSLSPALRTLALPSFCGPSDSALWVLGQLRCPPLRDLAVARVFPQEAKTHVVDFVNAHPHIEEFSWLFFKLFDGVHPSLQLPGLKRLDVTPFMSYIGVLEGKPPGSVPLSSVAISWLNPSALPHLRAINPATLRSIQITHMKDPSMLRVLSHRLRWRAIEVLSLPRSESAPNARQRLERVLRGERVCAWMLFSAGELLSLFPRLRVVNFSPHSHNIYNVPAPSPQDKIPSERIRQDLLAIRARYPQFESVYGWRMDRL